MNETSILVACIVLLFMLSKCQSSSREGFKVTDGFRKEVGRLSIGELKQVLRDERNKRRKQRDVEKIRYLSNIIRHEQEMDKIPNMTVTSLKDEEQKLSAWFNNRKKKDDDVEGFKRVQLDAVLMSLDEKDDRERGQPGIEAAKMIPELIVGHYVEGVKRYKKNVFNGTYDTGIKPLMLEAGNFANCLSQSNPASEKQAYEELAKCVNKMDSNAVYKGLNNIQTRVDTNLGRKTNALEPIPAAFELTGADIAAEFGGRGD